MLPDTSTPTARPCIARMMKKRMLKLGVNVKQPIKFQTVSHARAETTIAFGGTRSVRVPEMMTLKPRATRKEPTSQGS